MQTAVSDSELLVQYRVKQSEHSFELLVERYQSMVLGTAFRRTGNLETARDVTQRVFAVLARKSGLLMGRASVAGWLHQAAVYEAIRAAHAESRARSHNVPLSDEVAHTLSEPSPHLGTPERWVALEESIDHLAGPDREVLVLHYFQDLSYDEMARTLGVSEPAVRKRVSRALERLGAELRARGVAGNATVLL
ncbi:MAG TPA: RNA polymerase sigma factor, partial [Chthoniobacteraceae bacterium]|nr:RNA polymerase sigma factor [Chthoniobacteraceae bacterium]